MKIKWENRQRGSKRDVQYNNQIHTIKFSLMFDIHACIFMFGCFVLVFYWLLLVHLMISYSPSLKFFLWYFLLIGMNCNLLVSHLLAKIVIPLTLICLEKEFQITSIIFITVFYENEIFSLRLCEFLLGKWCFHNKIFVTKSQFLVILNSDCFSYYK